MAALEELQQAVHDLPDTGAERPDNVALLQRLQGRAQHAQDWTAAASELLAEQSPTIHLQQLQVLICCEPMLGTIFSLSSSAGIPAVPCIDHQRLRP